MSKRSPSNRPNRPPLYRFVAIQKDRTQVRGQLRAHTPQAAREQLHLRYAHLLSLEEVVESQWHRELLNYLRSNEALPVYTKSLAVMLDAGLPLAQIFEVAGRGSDRFLNEVMKDVGESLRAGRSLSASLARWPSVFDNCFVGMCRAAERSGRLHITFRRLADLLERRWILKKRLKAALTYPILISIVAIAIVWLLVVVVVPQLVPSFRDIGATMPLPTQILITISEFSTSMPLIGSVLAMMAVIAVFFYRMVLRGQHFPTVQLLWDQLLLRTPLFGHLYRLSILARSLSTMSALIECGLTMSDVLAIAGEVSGSPVYRRHFRDVLIEIKEGTLIADAMTSTGGFPPLAIGVVALGEESGKLPFLLSKIAQLYEEDFENHLNMLTTFIEPFLMGIMGLIIGFIVLGTFLPMINLISNL